MSKHIEPLIDRDVIPVIAGFFIKDKAGHLISLGRGGSDITAFLVGKYLNCDEVVIVTDVKGVFSSDPRQVKGANIIRRITANDLALFSKTGAQVLHPNALRFKSEGTEAQIVHFRDLGRLAKEGTIIEGAVNTEIRYHEKPLMLFTMTGHKLSARPGVLAQVSSWLRDKGYAIHALTAGNRYISVYLEGEVTGNLFNEMHETFIGKTDYLDGLTRVENIAEITLSNHLFIESPGIISWISDHLSREDINIIEMTTAHTDIVIYVSQTVLAKSLNILRERFGINHEPH